MHCNHLTSRINGEMTINSVLLAYIIVSKLYSKVLMRQVSRKSDHDPPNVRSKCIFAKLYKAKKHLDQGEDLIRTEEEGERKII